MLKCIKKRNWGTWFWSPLKFILKRGGSIFNCIILYTWWLQLHIHKNSTVLIEAPFWLGSPWIHNPDWQTWLSHINQHGIEDVPRECQKTLQPLRFPCWVTFLIQLSYSPISTFSYFSGNLHVPSTWSLDSFSSQCLKIMLSVIYSHPVT